MPRIYRRRETSMFYLDYEDVDGRRVRRSSGTADPEIAQARLRQVVRRVEEEQARLQASSAIQSGPQTAEEAAGTPEQHVHDELSALKERVAHLRRQLADRDAQIEALRQQFRMEIARIRNSHERKLEYLRTIFAHGIEEIDKR